MTANLFEVKSMRVNPNPMPDLMAALNQTELEEQQAELQISTGKSVNQPSDNPTAAALLVENNDQATFTAGYLQSISVVQGQLSTASSTLSSVSTALQQALSLGVEAAGGTLSPATRLPSPINCRAFRPSLCPLPTPLTRATTSSPVPQPIPRHT
jgi:hypothetical protein